MFGTKKDEQLQVNKPRFYFDIFEELEQNKGYAKKKSLIQFFKYFLSFSVIIVSTTYFLSNNQMWLVGSFVGITAIISAWNARKHYKELISLMDILSHIRYLNLEIIPRATLKSFSPIPIVVFIMGILAGTNSSTIKSLLIITDPLDFGIVSLKTIFLIVITLTLILYAVFIYNTWDRYKFLQFRGLQYQNAYDELKELKEKK